MNEVYARIDNMLPEQPGWCTVAKARRLAELVIDSRANLAVELGVYGGRSLIAMAMGFQHLGRGCAHGFDPYDAQAALEGRNDASNDQWWSALDYAAILLAAHKGIVSRGLLPYARLILARSQDAVSSYGSGTIDLLHQDSNHSEEVSTWEVDAWSPRIRSGGIWVMDDIDWNTTKAAQARLSTLGFECVERYATWAVYRKD